MKEKKNDRLMESKSNRNIYIWLFCLTVLMVILAGFFLYIWYKISTGNLKLEIKSDETYLTILITFAGFLAAFSAISIYSIFNANVDKEREGINILKHQLEEEKYEIEKKIKIWEDMNQEAQKKNKSLDGAISQISDILNNIIVINNLTSPYSSVFKKRDAIRYLSLKIDIDSNQKDVILNFYKSLESNQEEKSKRYFTELGDLLNKWGIVEI